MATPIDQIQKQGGQCVFCCENIGKVFVLNDRAYCSKQCITDEMEQNVEIFNLVNTGIVSPSWKWIRYN